MAETSRISVNIFKVFDGINIEAKMNINDNKWEYRYKFSKLNLLSIKRHETQLSENKAIRISKHLI